MNKINLRCLVLHILLYSYSRFPVLAYIASSLSCCHLPSNSFECIVSTWTVNFFAIFINHWRECSWEMQFLNYFWVSFYGIDGWIVSFQFSSVARQSMWVSVCAFFSRMRMNALLPTFNTTFSFSDDTVSALVPNAFQIAIDLGFYLNYIRTSRTVIKISLSKWIRNSMLPFSLNLNFRTQFQSYPDPGVFKILLLNILNSFFFFLYAFEYSIIIIVCSFQFFFYH